LVEVAEAVVDVEVLEAVKVAEEPVEEGVAELDKVGVVRLELGVMEPEAEAELVGVVAVPLAEDRVPDAEDVPVFVSVPEEVPPVGVVPVRPLMLKVAEKTV